MKMLDIIFLNSLMTQPLIIHSSRQIFSSSGPQWQVDYSFRTHVVDLQERNFACREWELTSIHCIHAIAVIRECKNDPEEFVDNYYTIETYMRCYSSIMNPLNGI